MESVLSTKIRNHSISFHDERKIIIKAMNQFIEKLEKKMDLMHYDSTPVPISMNNELMLAKNFIQQFPWKLEGNSIISDGEIMGREISKAIEAVEDALRKHL